MNLLPFRRQSTTEQPDPLAEHIAAEIEHICARISALSDEHEAIKAAMDRLYSKQDQILNRLERIDGRLERAEIDALLANRDRLETQHQLPDDVLALLRTGLDAGLPEVKEN